MSQAFLGLGSNLGDRLANLTRAVDLLDQPDMRVVGVSGVWETEPVGGPGQDPFLNLVLEVDTSLEPLAVLDRAQAAEEACGRVRRERWGPRSLDVDVLLVDDLTVEHPRLDVPHPRMWERRFVLAPLRELAPDRVPRAAVDAATGEVERLGELRDLAEAGPS